MMRLLLKFEIFLWGGEGCDEADKISTKYR